MDFIKEIEDKTHYRYGGHRHQQHHQLSGYYNEFLVFYLRPESNKSEGGYIYLDEALEKYSVLEISNNLDDIFNLGWPDGDFEFYKSWGTINKKIESYYPYHGSSYLFHGGGSNTSSKDVQDFSKRSIRPTFDQVREKIWRFKFVRDPQKKNSELIRDLIAPYLKRVKTEYDIEILKCEGGTMDLEFSPDLNFVKINGDPKVVNYTNFCWSGANAEWVDVDSTRLEVVDSHRVYSNMNRIENQDFILNLKID